MPSSSWTLYDSEDKVEAYEHFDPPLILEVDKVLGKIRNEKYRYFNSDVTLFPTLANKYEPEVIRELLHNAIAHQDYRLSSKINVLEYEDRLVFMNEGSFIPGTIEKAIEPGFKPRYYRNRLLSDVMSAGEKRITDFLIKHQSSAVSISQAELARKCDVSAPTVSRYVKRLGEKDYHGRACFRDRLYLRLRRLGL